MIQAQRPCLCSLCTNYVILYYINAPGTVRRSSVHR